MENTTLVTGASGATGQQLVSQLLERGQKVKVIVRSLERIPADWKVNEHISIIEASVLDLSIEEMAEHVHDCHAVASCLGHNLTLKGIWGFPRNLVTDAVSMLAQAIQSKAPEMPVKLVLMNTVGNRNKNLKEERTFRERIVLGIFRLLLPPQSDNEGAAEFLRSDIGQTHPFIEWVIVRPDSLKNKSKVTPYELHPSPIRSAIFNPGQTSRINVGHFMARLITEPDLWEKWKGRMPVIYDRQNN